MTSTQTRSINRIALRAGKKGARPAEVGALASVFEKKISKGCSLCNLDPSKSTGVLCGFMVRFLG